MIAFGEGEALPFDSTEETLLALGFVVIPEGEMAIDDDYLFVGRACMRVRSRIERYADILPGTYPGTPIYRLPAPLPD